MPQTNTRSPYALEQHLEASHDSDQQEEDEDEETLRLKLAAIEAKLKLKKLQQARDKGRDGDRDRDKDKQVSTASMKRSPDRNARSQTSPSRKRLRVDDPVQVPVSPLKAHAASAQTRSPARIMLGIDKGLRAQDVSLKRPRNSTAALGLAFERTPPRVKSFTERLADSRTCEVERAEKAYRIQNARGSGFADTDEQYLGRDLQRPAVVADDPGPSLLESARKRIAVTPSSRNTTTPSRRTTRTARPSVAPAECSDGPMMAAEDVDSHSGLRFSKRLIPGNKVTTMMHDKELYPLTRLLREVKAPSYDTPDCEADYVVFGAIASKSSPLDVKGGPKSTSTDTTSAMATNDKKFMVLHLTDLTWEVDLFLFGTAFSTYWRLPVGAVVAVLNPEVMPPRPHARDTGRFSLKLTSSADQILELGKARDLGFCRARRKDGAECMSWIDVRRTEYCSFHVELAVNKARAARMEVNGVARHVRSSSHKYVQGRPRPTFEGPAQRRQQGPGMRRDGETGEGYYLAPAGAESIFSGPSTKTLLDNEDRADPEMMRQRLAKAERERALRQKLSRIGNGAGAVYLRAGHGGVVTAGRAGDEGDQDMMEVAGEQPNPGASRVLDAASLGLVGRVEDVRLSPVKGRRRGLHEQAEPVGWAGAYKRGLGPQLRPGSPIKGQGRIIELLQPKPHVSESERSRATKRSPSPSRKQARFMLSDKGIREPGRDSLGDMAATRSDSDDDDLDII